MKRQSFGLCIMLFLMLGLLSACMSPWEPAPPHMPLTNIEDVGGELGARWVDVQIRDESTFALQDDGTLWGWGQNDRGQLGIGSTTEWNEFIIRPVQILDDVVEVFVGGSYVMVTRGDGSLWGWGDNSDGHLGASSRSVQVRPVRVMDDVEDVFFGHLHGSSQTIVMKTDGSLWRLQRSDPTWIMDDVDTVFVGDSYVMAIKTDGSLWGLGRNSWGQLGNGTTVSQSDPVWIMDDVGTISISGRSVMALRTDGSLWGWGRNSSGQLGIDTSEEDQLTPAWIMDDVVAISRASNPTHTMIIKADGSLWGWGNNRNGQVGIETITLQNYDRMEEDEQAEAHLAGNITWDLESPTWLMDDVVAVTAFPYLTMAIRSDDSLWGWGRNNSGQLGLGEDIRDDQTSPVLIMEDVADIDRGTVIRIDGSLWRLGRDGSTWLMDDVAELFVRSEATFALDHDGGLWFWGSNWIAQEGERENAISVVLESNFNLGRFFLAIIFFLFVIPVAIIASIICIVIFLIRRSERRFGKKVRTPWWFGFAAMMGMLSFIPLLIAGSRLKNRLWIGLGGTQLLWFLFGSMVHDVMFDILPFYSIGLAIYVFTGVRKKYLAFLEEQVINEGDSAETPEV